MQYLNPGQSPPTELVSVVFSDAPDNCLIPRLKKLLFPVRDKLTAQRAKSVTLNLVWVCVCAHLYVCSRVPAWQQFVLVPLPTLLHLLSHY